MKININGYYLIVLNDNQQYNCKIVSEYETGYFAYLFIIQEGELFSLNPLGHIPEAIYDQRIAFSFEKKNVRDVFSIYVVNSKYFEANYVIYKVGRKNMYRISSQYKKGSDVKVSITDSMFPYSTFSQLLMNEGHNWMQIRNALLSNELNKRYDYFTFTNCVSDRIQHEISLYKDDSGRSTISLTMISIMSELVIELFEDICRNPTNDVECSNVISRYNNSYGLLRVTKEEHKQSLITVVVNDVDRLKPIFGDDFHMFPCNHPYEGAVDTRNNMYRIPKYESNIKFQYDILSKSLKISFKVCMEMVTAVHPEENPVMLNKKFLESQIKDQEFYDQTLQRYVKIVDVDIETNIKKRGPSIDELTIRGYVSDAKFLEYEPQLKEKVKYDVKYKESLCYNYRLDQIDIQNKEIKHYDKKQKRVLEKDELTKKLLQKHAFHEDMEDDSSVKECLQNIQKNKKLRTLPLSQDVFRKLGVFVNEFENEEDTLNNIDKYGSYVINQMKGILNVSQCLR